MSTVNEIETAIAKLKPVDKRKVATWISVHCQTTTGNSHRAQLRKGRGLWKNRKDLPDIRALRASFDRF